MKAVAIGLLLALHTADPDLVVERDRLDTAGTRHAMVTIVTTWADGSPVNKGWLSCSGEWFTHDDEPENQVSEAGKWFPMDARGAVILLSGDANAYLTCRAEKDGKVGEGGIWFEDGSVQRIVINARP